MNLNKEMKEFNVSSVKYYINIGSHLVPVVHGGDWVKIEDFTELLDAYDNLKTRKRKMIEAIVEVWCSPSRREDYSVNIIPLFAGEMFQVEDDIKSYIDWTGDFYSDAFGDDFQEVKGLWKVVFALGVRYCDTYDHEGTPDGQVEFSYAQLSKDQCSSWQEVKYMWLSLKEKQNN